VPPAGARPRATRGRRALVAAAGVGCLLVGGVGGYLLGHAAGPAAGAATPAGFPGGGPAGGFGGPGDGVGGFRHHDLPGVGPQDGTGTGTGSGAAGGDV
jgi:hypothetical protein